MTPRIESLVRVMIAVLMVAAAAGLYYSVANGQTPPVSAIYAPVDTVYGDRVILNVGVSSDIPWNGGGGVGIYYTTDPGSGNWTYLGYAYYEFIWAVPDDSGLYYLASSVTDDAGNNEGHEFTNRTEIYICSGCTPPAQDCPPPSVLASVQVIAEFDPSAVSVEILTLEWYWTLATTGTPAVSHTLFYETLTQAGDTLRAEFPGLTRMDSLYGYHDMPYPVAGEWVRASVAGVDSLGRMGPKAVYSAPWFGDDGPPGQTGQALKRAVLR